MTDEKRQDATKEEEKPKGVVEPAIEAISLALGGEDKKKSATVATAILLSVMAVRALKPIGMNLDRGFSRAIELSEKIDLAALAGLAKEGKWK